MEHDPDLPEGTVVAAREQTAGRGRRGRIWDSTGENLIFSVLLRGLTGPKNAPSAAMAAAMAVADLLKDERLKPSLKWPNDVLVNDRKICGILSEGVSGGVIIGIGLNVNMESAGHIDQPATSLLIETGARRDPASLLKKLLPSLSTRLEKWKEGGFSAIRKDWEAGAPMFGKTVKVREGDTMRSGLHAGFGQDGELLLRTKSGDLLSVWAGELIF